jgi:hypothetical protein
MVIADGNMVGNDVIPEIFDLNIAQSCRGYYPGGISHYQAPWANKFPEQNPIPVWPGKIGDQEYTKASLEAYYQPWINLGSARGWCALRRMWLLEKYTPRRIPGLVWRCTRCVNQSWNWLFPVEFSWRLWNIKLQPPGCDLRGLAWS